MFSRSLLFFAIVCSAAVSGCSELVGADFDDKRVARNRPPSAEDAVLENVVEGTTGNTLQLIASDPDQDPLTFELASHPRGTATFTDPRNGWLAYDSFYGALEAGVSDPFRYRVGDPVLTAEASVTVRLLPAGPQTLEPWLPPLPRFPTDRSYFGASVDFDGDRAIVGATGDGAYTWQRQDDGTWKRDTKIEAPSDMRDRAFGLKAALSGEWVLIGAFGRLDLAPSPHGRAYFYKRTEAGYGQPQMVCASPSDCDTVLPGVIPDRFGMDLVLEGRYAVIAARDDTIGEDPDPKKNIPGAGAIYVYELEGEQWKQVAKLRAPTPAVGDLFGSSLALDGEALVVAASGTDTPIEGQETAENTGALYVYDNATWREAGAEPARLPLPPVGAANLAGYEFGQLALSGNQLLVGAPEAGGQEGAAYVLDRSSGQWTPLSLPESWPASAMRLGAAVAIDGDIAVVTHRDNINNGGAVMYRREVKRPGNEIAWRVRKVWANDEPRSAGWAAAARGPSVLVGGPHGGANGNVFVFHLPLQPGAVFPEWKD